MSTQGPEPGSENAYNLDRFVRMQDSRGNYATALSEIQAGRKDSHWMWFIFPQIAGLGRHPSEMAQRYAISSIAEAKAYLTHPVLGPRLREISQAVLDSPEKSVEELMGVMKVDQQKLKSSMTLFKRAAYELPADKRHDGNAVFGKVLEKYFDGEEDENTIEKLRRIPQAHK